MTTYFEHGITLTNNQKSKLAPAIRNNSPLTLRLNHSHLRGSDELMLTKTQINKIKKSVSNGTGTDIKILKTQIRKSVKHGGNLSTSLASLGATVLPYAVKGISKVAPALATGVATSIGENALNKIFGKAITIPKKIITMLPIIKQELTKSQIDQLNRAYQSGGRLVIKPTRKQVEGGFLGTLASIGIPMAISLVSKMFGSGLQVDRQVSSNTRNVYVPPVKTHGDGYYPYQSPPFFGNWENPTAGMGVKEKDQTKGKRKRTITRSKQSLQFDSNSRLNFINKPLSNFDLFDWITKLGIKHFRDIFSRDALPKKIEKECGIVNLDDNQGPGTH